jgi:hypothetical protein
MADDDTPSTDAQQPVAQTTSPSPASPGGVRVIDTLDTTENDASQQVTEKPTVEKLPYQIELEREKKRGVIATTLVWLLVGIVGVSFLTTHLRSITGWDLGGLQVKDVKEILTIIFSPIVALVGTVVGFYFGGKSEASLPPSTS